MFVPFLVFLNPSTPQDRDSCGTPEIISIKICVQEKLSIDFGRELAAFKWTDFDA